MAANYSHYLLDKKKKKVIVLASSSPRRKDLLKGLGCRFQVIPSTVEEKINPSLSAKENVFKIARLKALDVGQKVEKGIVVAADTLVTLEQEIFPKPKNKSEARKMLRKLSGKEHQVVTGLVVFSPEQKKLLKKIVVTKVKLIPLSEKMIRDYLRTEEFRDKAGSYAIQGKGALLVESINGDYYNVIGLPLSVLEKLLEKFGISLLG